MDSDHFYLLWFLAFVFMVLWYIVKYIRKYGFLAFIICIAVMVGAVAGLTAIIMAIPQALIEAGVFLLFVGLAAIGMLKDAGKSNNSSDKWIEECIAIDEYEKHRKKHSS